MSDVQHAEHCQCLCSWLRTVRGTFVIWLIIWIYLEYIHNFLETAIFCLKDLVSKQTFVVGRRKLICLIGGDVLIAGEWLDFKLTATIKAAWIPTNRYSSQRNDPALTDFTTKLFPEFQRRVLQIKSSLARASMWPVWEPLSDICRNDDHNRIKIVTFCHIKAWHFTC